MNVTIIRQMAAALIIAAVALTGCKKRDWSDEIDDLQRRMANLEQLSVELKQKVAAGAMVKSVTSLAGGGWSIEFTNGTTIDVSSASKTDIRIGANGNWHIDGKDTGVQAAGKNGTPGADGDTPHIGANGNWYIGDTDTGVKAESKDGAPGADGRTPYIGANGNWFIGSTDTGVKAAGEDGAPGGTPGADGDTPHIGANGNWYIGDTDTGIPARGLTGEKGDRGDPGADGKDGDTMIAGIVNNNADGTVTIILNDAENTRYTFRKASTAVSFAILNVDGPEIGFGGTGVVRFAVNPSNAYISTSLTDWMLCDVNTGTAAANFTLEGIAPDGAAAGQYTATIRCSTAVETVAALKLNAGSAANPAWVSSSAFKIGIASSSSITMTANKNGNVDITVISTGTKTIDWGDGKAPQTFGSGFLLAYYTYIGSGTTHNIVIDGQNITGLRSHSMQLSKLDVTKSTALTELSCNNNSLTSLDVTKNTALTELKVQSNQFTAAGLNALFGTLHSNAGTKTIYIYGNSGTATCNRTIATDKGWTVDFTTAGDQ